MWNASPPTWSQHRKKFQRRADKKNIYCIFSEFFFFFIQSFTSNICPCVILTPRLENWLSLWLLIILTGVAKRSSSERIFILKFFLCLVWDNFPIVLIRLPLQRKMSEVSVCHIVMISQKYVSNVIAILYNITYCNVNALHNITH